MRKGKKFAITMAACALVAAMGVGGSLAYLTDNDSATNTFTVGEVDITLEEPDWPEPDEPLTPNEEVQKNPQIKVGDDKSDAVVFLEMTVPAKEITLVADDGTKGEKTLQDLVWFKATEDAVTAHANHFSENWVEVKKEAAKDADTPSTYVFGYKTKVTAGDTTDPLFDKIQLKNFIEKEVAAKENLDINIKAYAIQADNILGSAGAAIETAGDLDKTTLEEIYNIYVKQNTTD